MAKCRLCKTDIPDGTEYCIDCMNKSKANESYLDSLLNSVINTQPSTNSNYKKNKDINIVNSEPVSKESMETEQDDLYPYTIDLEDIEDFDEFDIVEDMEDSIVIGDEELFGKELSDIFAEDNKKTSKQEIKEEQRKPEIESPRSEEQQVIQPIEPESPCSQSEDKQDQQVNLKEYQTEEQQKAPEEQQKAPEIQQKTPEIQAGVLVDPSDSLQSNPKADEIPDLEEEDTPDTSFNDLLNELNLSEGDVEEAALTDEDHLPLHDGLEQVNLDEIDDMEHMESEEDDFIKLLNQISADDPVASDVQAISDMLNGNFPDKQEKANMPSNVGEVFSDALKVVSSLDDEDMNERDLLEQIPDKKERKKQKKDKKQKKEKASKNIETIPAEKVKKSFAEKLFGNVQEEDIKKKPAKSKNASGEIAATKEEPKKGKKKAGKNKIEEIAIGKDNDNDLGDTRRGREQQLDKQPDKKASKKEKKEKKKKDREVIQVINEVEEDEGRINRIGTSIVLLFFGLFVMLLLIGTNLFSYSLSIHNATNYFDRQKYTQAYNEVYGIDIEDEDIEIYDKIMTVMFVNKQLNSYNSYYAIKQYPEALDSLLKGLSRYDKYIELATMLGIKSDLDYVRNQIVAELNNVFNLTESEAFQIIKNENQAQYSMNVYDVVLEKMNN